MHKLDFIQRGRAVRRYHTMPMHVSQRIDAHSYGVAMLVRLLIPNAPPERLLRLLTAALDHDLAEHIVGDMPAPAKRAMGEQGHKAFNEHEERLLNAQGLGSAMTLAEDRRVLKMADMLEGCLYCIEDRMMGNQYVREAFMNFWSYLEQLEFRSKIADREAGEEYVYGYVTAQWRLANQGKW